MRNSANSLIDPFSSKSEMQSSQTLKVVCIGLNCMDINCKYLLRKDKSFLSSDCRLDKHITQNFVNLSNLAKQILLENRQIETLGQIIMFANLRFS